jgi:hypothetical protein
MNPCLYIGMVPKDRHTPGTFEASWNLDSEGRVTPSFCIFFIAAVDSRGSLPSLEACQKRRDELAAFPWI